MFRILFFLLPIFISTSNFSASLKKKPKIIGKQAVNIIKDHSKELVESDIAVNEAPVITGQQPLVVEEDGSLTLELSHFTVSDVDSNYPEGFTLSVFAGENYTVSGTTIIPVANYNGLLIVQVTVNDGTSNSNVFDAQVIVNAVNDAPQITDQTAVDVNENQSVTIDFSHLIVVDPDNTYPSGFSLVVFAGENYTVSGNTITPSPGYNGALSVPVTVSDGMSTSNEYALLVTVNAINSAPIITGQQPLSINEDQSLTIEFSHLIVTDDDNVYPDGFSLNVGSGQNYTVNGTVITPASNFSGTLVVPVTVSDGVAVSNSFDLTIQVDAVNDPPRITGQSPLSVQENGSITLSLSDFQVSDPDNIYPNGFTLIVLAGSNYSISGNTVTPTPGFAGNISVGVKVSDGMLESEVFNAQLSVQGVNDRPVITAQVNLQTNEEQSLTIQLTHLTVTDPDNVYPQDFKLSVATGDNYTVSGTTITPAKDFNGVLSIPVTVNDGTSNSSVFNLQVTVVPVNDAPVITGQVPLAVLKNKTIEILLSHLTVSDVDNSYPADFTLNVGDGRNYTVVNNVVLPATDFTGTLTIPVTVNDGTISSAPFNFKLQVNTPPNVVPVIVSHSPLTTYKNEPITLDLSHLVVTDPDNRYPEDFKLVVYSGVNYTVAGTTISPAFNYTGSLTVRVAVSDKESTSEPFSLKVEVLPTADIPIITNQEFLRINEDDSLLIELNQLIVLDPDSNYPNGFTLSVLDGDNYSINGRFVKPDLNFTGYLSIPVTVNDGVNTSSVYLLLVLVDPVNDPPVITENTEGNLFYSKGNGGLKILEDILLADVDDDSLSLAEIAFNAASYESGRDSLAYEINNSIRVVFDRSSGTLVLFGQASVASYQALLRSITYYYLSEAEPAVDTKSITVTISDGKASSLLLTRVISFGEESIVLDVPSGFTPNGDGINDTWNIKFSKGNIDFKNARIRIYNRNGNLVFESTGLATEWDGSMNGMLLPADTYFYTIDLQGATSKNRYKGIINILR